MKYGYHFHDWGLWDIDELLEVRDLEEDYITRDAFGEHKFDKEHWAWVKVNDEKAFIEPHLDEKGHFKYTYTDEGPYYKANIFDTREAAEAYAKEHSSCLLF